jgi:hypothetical protein
VRGLFASIILVVLVYGRSLGFEFARSREERLAEAVGLVDLAGVWNGLFMDLSRLTDGIDGFAPLWRPSVNFAYLMAGWIGGGEAWGFRLVAMLALVVIGWRARLMVGRNKGRALVLCLIVFHPMTSAAVVDISAMPSLLLALGAVLALTSQGRRPFWWTLFALGAHEAAAIIPLIAIGFNRDGRGKVRDDGRWRWPLIAVGGWWAMLALLRFGGMLSDAAISVPKAENMRLGAANLWFYMGRLLMPLDPVFARSEPNFLEPWPALAWVALLVVLLVVVRGERPRKNPVGPGFAAGICCVLLALLATGGLMSEQPGYGEGRLALPIVGFAWMVASRAIFRNAAWVLLPMLFTLSSMRVGVWSDPVKLWAESHRAQPRDTMVSLEYGKRIQTSKPALAVGLFEQVLADGPEGRRAWQAHVGMVHSWLALGSDERALPHLAQIANPTEEENSWLLVRRCLIETRFGVDERDYAAGVVLFPLARVCGEAANRYPKDARLANAAGVEAAVRGDFGRAREFLQRAVELAPHSAEVRRNFSRIPMNVAGWVLDEPISPDPAAAP